MKLNLGDNNLSILPESIGCLVSLTHLKVRQNSLRALPQGLGRLRLLTYLDAAFNDIHDVPEGLWRSNTLVELYLRSNKLEGLPPTIGQCAALSVLDVAHNAIASLPESIGECVALQKLYATSNKLQELPAALAELTSLTELEVCFLQPGLVSHDYPNPHVPAAVEAILSRADLDACGITNALHDRQFQATVARLKAEHAALVEQKKAEQEQRQRQREAYVQNAATQPAPPVPFAGSNFRRLYVRATPADGEAYTIAELRAALRAFCQSVAEHPALNLDAKRAASFAAQLERPARAVGQLSRGLSSLTAAPALTTFAVRVWTSSARWSGRELCSLLNQVIREDGALVGMAALSHAVVLCRALNQVLCRENEVARQMHVWPRGPSASDSEGRSDERDATFRGGGMPREHRAFFAVGLKYRTRQYMATSFKRSVAVAFAETHRTPPESHPVVWTIKLPPMGCLHVNLIENLTQVKGEYEFLFPAYSTFTVEAIEWSEPHWSITVLAAADNRSEPEDLPTAPWC